MADNSETPPLTRQELAHYRQEAAAGRLPSLEIIRRFIATIRKGWTSKPEEKTKGKSRTKAPTVTEDKIDFF